MADDTKKDTTSSDDNKPYFGTRDAETDDQKDYVEDRLKSFLGDEEQDLETAPDKDEDKDKKPDADVDPDKDTSTDTDTSTETDKDKKPDDDKKGTEVDVEDFKKEVSGKISEEVTNRLIKRLTGKERKDIEIKPKWEQEGKKTPGSYKEIGDYAAEVAEQKVTKKIEAKEQKAQQSQEELKKQSEGRKKELNTYWSNQLDNCFEE
jgi:hypothetical protein